MRETHISLLFVRPEFHRRGIAKQLFLRALEETPETEITVKTSSYAGCVCFILLSLSVVTLVINGLKH